MANLNNPAGRLLYWLEQGKQQPQGESAMAGWCRVFGLDHSITSDRVECAHRGTMLMQLAREARYEASQLPPGLHPEVMLAHFGEVETALDHFTILAGTTMQNMYVQIGGTGWQSLAMLDAMLSTHRPEPVVEHQTIRDHIQQVSELIDAIIDDGELDVALKRFLLDRLREVQKALVDALLTGPREVALAANALYGSAQLQPDWWDRIAKTRWAPRVAAVWGGLMMTLGAGSSPAAWCTKSDPSSL